MYGIDSKDNGVFMFHTESGSWYVLTITGKKVTLKRSPKEEKLSLRRDYEELVVISCTPIIVGKNAVFVLEPLGKGDNTLRITTKVIQIIRCEQHNKIQ